MSVLPDVLWLNVSPAFRRFDRPLLQALAKQETVAQWEYVQTLDEPNSFETALALLHGYLRQRDCLPEPLRPIHLVGHSTGGLLGLLYARQHPEWVKSLTLLSVGANPAVDWQAHYYAQMQFLRCSRYMLLAQMAYNLFGCQSRSMTHAYVKILEQDLLTALSPHTLFRRANISPSGVSVPLMVFGGTADIVIDPNLFEQWQNWLKPSDRLWLCPGGEHFFHKDHPDWVSEQMLDFWNLVPDNAGKCYR